MTPACTLSDSTKDIPAPWNPRIRSEGREVTIRCSVMSPSALQTPPPCDDTAGLPSLQAHDVRRKKEILFPSFHFYISMLLSLSHLHHTSLALSLIPAPAFLPWFPGDSPGLYSQGLSSASLREAIISRPFRPGSVQSFFPFGLKVRVCPLCSPPGSRVMSTRTLCTCV